MDSRASVRQPCLKICRKLRVFKRSTLRLHRQIVLLFSLTSFPHYPQDVRFHIESPGEVAFFSSSIDLFRRCDPNVRNTIIASFAKAKTVKNSVDLML